MLKGFYIWNRLTPFLKRLILLICFILEIPLGISYFHKIYVSYLGANPWLSEMWQLLLFGFFVLYFASILFRMAGKEMEDFSLIEYWTSLSYFGCYTYIICRLLPWIELGLFFSLMFGIYDYVSPLLILPGVLSIDFVAIFLGIGYTKAKSVKGKSARGFTERKCYIIRTPFLQLLWIILWQRMRCVDVTLITVLINAIFLVLCKVVKGEIRFVAAVIFMALLFILQDRFFENEGKSFAYYQSIGIPLKKYLIAQVCASLSGSALQGFGMK